MIASKDYRNLIFCSTGFIYVWGDTGDVYFMIPIATPYWVLFVLFVANIVSVATLFNLSCRSAVASWLVCSPLHRAVKAWALVRDIVLCSLGRHLHRFLSPVTFCWLLHPVFLRYCSPVPPPLKQLHVNSWMLANFKVISGLAIRTFVCLLSEPLLCQTKEWCITVQFAFQVYCL